MRSSELKISIPVESYDEKTTENYRYCYIAEKRIISKLSKIWMPNIIAEIEDMKISRSYLLYFPRNKPSESVTIGSGQVGSSTIRP